MANLSNRNRSSYRDRIREQREEKMARLEREAKRSNKAAKLFMLLLLVGWFVLTHIKRADAADGKIIDKINVKFTQNYGDGGETLEPTITTSTGNISIEDISYAKEPDKWKPGNRVLVTINFSAASGYYFGAVWNREAVTLNDAEFSHCGRIDDGEILQLKVYYVPCAVLGDTASAGWDYKFKKAVWKEVDYAPGYEVKLYKNDEEVGTKKVRTTTVDFSDKIEDYTKDKFDEDSKYKVNSRTFDFIFQFYGIDSEYYVGYKLTSSSDQTYTSDTKTYNYTYKREKAKYARLFNVKQTLEKVDLSGYKKDYSSYANN